MIFLQKNYVYDVATLISFAATAVVSESAGLAVIAKQIPVANLIPLEPKLNLATSALGTATVKTGVVVPTVTVALLYSFTYIFAAPMFETIMLHNVPAVDLITVPFVVAAELRKFVVGVTGVTVAAKLAAVGFDTV